MTEENLDKIAAEVGFELADTIKRGESNKEKIKNKAKELERTLTKVLGILIEDGLYAYAIWLESEGETEITNKSFELLKDKTKLIENSYTNNKEKLRKAIIEEISTSIEKTLLARQLIERMLVYARYRAKALQKGD